MKEYTTPSNRMPGPYFAAYYAELGRLDAQIEHENKLKYQEMKQQELQQANNAKKISMGLESGKYFCGKDNKIFDAETGGVAIL